MLLRHRPRIALVLLALVALVADPVTAAPAPLPDARAPSAPAHVTPRVALTFDDGWSEGNCRSIARTLRAHDVTATFFINSAIMARDPDGWRSILAGFAVGNHTSRHRDLTSQSTAGIRSQIVVDEQKIEAILGRQMTRVLRPPYGALDDRVRAVARDLGYRIVLWNVSAADTSSAATVGRVIRNATQGHDGAIVLMHCGPNVTPPALDAIIHHYRSAGFRFVSVGQMLGVGF